MSASTTSRKSITRYSRKFATEPSRSPGCGGRRADDSLLTHPTLDQLGQLGLTGMAQAFAELEASGEATDLSHTDWLGLLLDRELTHRRDKRLAARLRYARLRNRASVEDVDYRASRGLDRALFQKLAKGDWIELHDNLILCGPTGVGKSWLACALAHQGLP